MVVFREQFVAAAAWLLVAAAILLVGVVVDERLLTSVVAGAALSEGTMCLTRRHTLIATLILLAVVAVPALATSDWSSLFGLAACAPIALLLSRKDPEPLPPYPEPIGLGRRPPTRPGARAR